MGARTHQLVCRASRGDDRALDALVRRFGPALLRAVRRRLGPQLRARLESGDVVQDSLVEALRSLERFQPRDDRVFLAWLVAIAENRLRNEARTARRRPAVTGCSGELSAVSGPSEISRFDRGDERAHRLALVELSLRRMSGEQRRVLELRREGSSFAAIGQELGRSEDAARMLHTRAVAKLVETVHGLRRAGPGL